jgi:hypothetical protein
MQALQALALARVLPSAQGGTLAIPGQVVDKATHLAVLVACAPKVVDPVVAAQVLPADTRAPAAAIATTEADGPGTTPVTDTRTTRVLVGVALLH